MKRAWSLVLGSSILVACGGGGGSKGAATAASASAPRPAATAAATASGARDALPANAIRRSAVHQTIARGLGAFLQRVEVDDHPVFLAGKFHGFRVAALHDPAFWRGVDLRPGDVVTRVNGMPIEHPEEALEAFRSLDVASELRVDYERDGVPRELRFVIVDDEPPASSRRADASAP